MPEVRPQSSAVVSNIRQAGRIAAVGVALGGLALASAWMFSPWSYTIDLIANLGAQVLLICLCLGLIILVFRQWLALAIIGVACLVQLWPLVTNRAAFFPRQAAQSSADAVRFLHYNDSCLSDKRLVYDLMERSGADVLSILCPPVSMQADVNYGRGLEDRYPGKLTRQWGPAPDQFQTSITACILVSRWPIEKFDTSMAGPLSEHFIAGIVRRPGGPFGVVCMHPRSPRTPERWREGNALVEAAIGVVGALRSRGLPVVVLTDLNATPTGLRSRRLCEAADLRHAKPLFEPAGTFPRVVPLNIRTNRKSDFEAFWPMVLAIDDALVSPEIGVLGWQVGRHLASEHRPVHIDLEIPRLAASGANQPDR